MVKAYSCSCLNIAALDVPDGETGCLFSGRNPSVVHGCKVSAFQTPHQKKPSPFNCSRVGYNANLFRIPHLLNGHGFAKNYSCPAVCTVWKIRAYMVMSRNMATESFSETLKQTWIMNLSLGYANLFTSVHIEKTQALSAPGYCCKGILCRKSLFQRRQACSTFRHI